MKNRFTRIVSLIAAIAMLTQICLTALPVAVQAEEASIFTDYLPEITQVTDEAGFTHPGVGLTKELLEQVRTKVRAGAQPWTYYFNTMLVGNGDASKTIQSSNSADGLTPSADSFNSQGIQARFIDDSVKAYTQALMYVITGDEAYRANALMLIRIWSKMDPAKYQYYNDAHIHAGIPLNKMVTAAEIIRYTSTQNPDLAWKAEDTAQFTNNLITPVIETFLHSQHRFMNQHTYPIIGAMAGYIFTGNRDRYNEAVEWTTVNRTANDQGFNGAIKALFRLVTEEQQPGTLVGEGTPIAEPYVQHMEMGRDQAHGGGDITNAAMLSRMLFAQGTKLDPVAGTPSTADNAVDIMEFLDDTLIRAADYFWQFMLGYDTVWTPQAYAITGGDPDHLGQGGYIRDTYNYISQAYKGRFLTANFWDFYSYYTYKKQQDVSKLAPYFYEAFTKKLTPSPSSWENPDGGTDFWLYLPAEAEADAATFIPQNKSTTAIYEAEERYTNLTKLDMTKSAVKENNNKHAIKTTNNIDEAAVTALTEGDTSFIRLHAKEAGSKIAIVSSGRGNGTYGLRIRTNGVAKLDAMGQSAYLPDTNGEWTYFAINGNPGNYTEFTVTGAPGITVDVDHIKSDSALTPPVFADGSDLTIYTYTGATVNANIVAADAGSSDVIAYGLQSHPAGSSIDSSTGAFTWQPSEAGNYSFIITATDGTVIQTLHVNVIVSSDRAAAVQAIAASYDANEVYVQATLDHYLAVYNETISQIDTASEEAFGQQLQALRAATEGLKFMTPLASNGSMRWSSVAASSSWGANAGYLDDVNMYTGAGGSLGSPPHLHQIIDFGPDYKVSTTKFGFQSNIFADRVANSTVYGSNDKINWIRITPGASAYTQAYNTIDVDPAYQNEKYRFIKVEMVKPLPDVLYDTVRNIFEMREFHIYGTRHDIGNKLQTVSLSSDQAFKERAPLGSAVNVSITATEAIQNVKVAIQGQDAVVSTTDHINWTATAVLTGIDQTGDVKVSVDYQKQDGTNGDTVYGTTDGSKLSIVNESDVIRDVTSITNLIDSTPGRSADATLQMTNRLFDGDFTASTDYRSSNGGAGSFITFDFKEGNVVQLTSVELVARQDQFYTRIKGTIVQGSNDNETWTRLTPSAAESTAEWQTLKVSDTGSYRYIRIYNGNSWYGNMSEVKFHGVVKNLSKIESASIFSDQAMNGRIVSGDTVKVSFVSKEAIQNVRVAIQGQDATVTTQDNINWIAEATMNQGATAGPVTFVIDYDQQDGAAGYPITETSDKSSLVLADESDVIRDVTGIAGLIDSTPGRDAATTLQITDRLFDGDASMSTDYRTSSGGWGGFITFDFKEGNVVRLTNVELLARQDQYSTRMSGTVVQGSNDNETWITLTAPATSTLDWQMRTVSDTGSYRYIRIYNKNNWYGNMAELRLHGDVKTLTKIDTVSIGSDQSVRNRIVPGDTVTLSFHSPEEINDVMVNIQGQAATVSSADNMNWTAEAVMVSDVNPGAVSFSIDYKTQEGFNAPVLTSTTDGSTLYIADETGLIRNVLDITDLSDSSGRNPDDLLIHAGRLFDNQSSTVTDFRLNGKGNGGSITFDFKEGNHALLTKVELLARQDSYYTRISGAVVRGSNDNVNWTTISPGATSTPEWQTLTINSTEPYRYIRIYNWNSWYGNMAELRLYGEVKAVDGTPPMTTDDAPQAAVNQDTVINLSADDTESGVAATYYTVNGGEQQTGKAIALTEEGTHTVVYWSVDNAGNVEDAHIIVVNIDKKAPTATVAYSTTEQTDDVVVAAITPSEPVTILNNDGLSSYTFIFNGSYTFDFVDAAGNAGTITATVNNMNERSTGVPGTPVLSDDNGYDGLQNGNYNISMNMWYGNNGRIYKLYENDVLIETKILTDNAPNAQSTVTSITYRPNGTYNYYAELINAHGTTRSSTHTVTVTQSAPAKPVLSNDNWDHDGNFNVNMNMWWGINAATYNLYENGVLIYTQQLTDNTPSAQSAITVITNRAIGTYEYRAELVGYAGATSSDIMSVTVTR